jgi:MFS family permease
MRRVRLDRLLLPAKRLIFISFVIDVGAACTILGVQLKGIELHATPFMLGLLGSAQFSLYLFICIIAGHLSDRLGRRFMTVGASAVCLASWAGMALATTVWQLLPLAVLSGTGLALLWPPIEAWLADLAGDSVRVLNRHIGLFNIAWTAGLMVGPLVAGQLWEARGEGVFLIAGGAALLCLLMAVLTPTAPPANEHVAPPAHVPPERVRWFLHMAWLAMAAAVFARGMLGACFPKLAVSLGFSPTLLGRLLFVLAAGQGVAFLVTRMTTGWQYRLWALFVPPVVGLAAILSGAFTNNAIVFAAGFVLVGGALGVSYMCGITYALQAGPKGRGKRAGLHEGIMGLGLVLGPFVGGLAGQYLNLHAPFLAAAGVFAVAMVVQLILWVRLPAAGPVAHGAPPAA